MPDAVTLETYDWPSQGDRPGDTTIAGYRPGEEPLAETDNDWNHSVRNDLESLNGSLGSLESRVDSMELDVVDLLNRVSTLESDFSGHNHDSRYYRKTTADDTFYPKSGGHISGGVTMDGDLYCWGDHVFFGSTESVILPQRTSKPPNPRDGATFILE